MASQSGTSSGPFTVTVSNLPFGWGGLISISVQRLTCPRQRPSAQPQGWYPASYPRRSTEGRPCRRGFPVVSTTGIRLLGILLPPRSSVPSRSAYQAASAWTRRDFHVPHIRVTAGLGAPYPEAQRCSHDRSDPSGRRSPPLPGARPYHPGPHPISRAVHYEASSRVHSRSPARPSPRLVIPWMDQGPWLFPGLRTPTGRDLRRTPGGRHRALAELHDRHRRTSYP